MRRIATGMAAAVMVLAACGSSSKSSTTGTTAGGSGTTAAGSPSTTSGGGDNTGSGGNSKADKAKIKVTYTESGSAAGSKPSTLVYAQDGKGKAAFSSQDTSDASTPVTTLYVDGKSLVECVRTGSAAQCTTVPAAEAALGSTVTVAFSTLATIVHSVSGGDKSSDTIAGRDATCWKFKSQDIIAKLASNPIFKNSDTKVSDYNASDTSTVCLDKKTDFPLKFTGTKKGAPEDQFSATAVGDPTDADLTPPATPTPAPSDTIPTGTSAP